MQRLSLDQWAAIATILTLFVPTLAWFGKGAIGSAWS